MLAMCPLSLLDLEIVGVYIFLAGAWGVCGVCGVCGQLVLSVSSIKSMVLNQLVLQQTKLVLVFIFQYGYT